MASPTNVYNVVEERFPTELRFVFFSIGKRVVTKIIAFVNSHQFEGRDVYNLGFGDYDPTINDVEDQAKTNNGDAYKVFNTVLSTVPLFFEMFPNAILMVQGSDSSADFVEKCRTTCTKRCRSACRKFNQRVAVYRRSASRSSAIPHK